MSAQVAEVNRASIGWIRQARSLGVPIGDAIRLALGGNIAIWAKQRHLNRTIASGTIWCARPPVRAVVEAIAADLNCEETDILEVLAEGAKQRALAVGA